MLPNMRSLTRYVGYHLNFRYLRVLNKRRILTVFVIFLVFFLSSEWLSRPGVGLDQHSDDQLIMLKAQIGYLKRKLATHMAGSPDSNDRSVPTIYVITPTYARPEQRAELTRLCHTFLLVPNLHWIVIEDSTHTTQSVKQLLDKCGVAHTLLYELTPYDKKPKSRETWWRKPRGIVQRNTGLFWIRDHFRDLPTSHQEGVIYFADDDNTYSLELFEEMRQTQKVSVWPVGLVGGLMVEKPRVQGSKVVGWDVVWAPERPFALDMAGFAVNLGLFLSKSKAKFAYGHQLGYQETEFLKHLVTMDELEPKADSCTKVLVWHTKSQEADLKREVKLKEINKPPSDQNILV